MTNGSAAISVSGVSKTYRIGHRSSANRASEAIVQFAKNPFRRTEVTHFDALHELDFEIAQGEAVGIIGRNGAGKSTLLKLLTRITAPTTGRIELHGRVGSLLEVGTGFHPELTGRENIYLNGTLLGMRRREIERRFDEIVDFSGVEKFLDTPVKRYSSGMYVRLAFAVAAHLETEILAIDEVLAVGDAEFQRKSLAKMRDAAADGRTVLYVSHQMQTVLTLCTSALFLQAGGLSYQGDVNTAMARYRESFDDHAAAQVEASRRPGTGEVRATSVTTDATFHVADTKVVEIEVEGNSGGGPPVLRLGARQRCQRRRAGAVRLARARGVARPGAAAPADAVDRQPLAAPGPILGRRVRLPRRHPRRLGGGGILRDPAGPAVSGVRRGRGDRRRCRADRLQLRGGSGLICGGHPTRGARTHAHDETSRHDGMGFRGS